MKEALHKALLNAAFESAQDVVAVRLTKEARRKDKTYQHRDFFRGTKVRWLTFRGDGGLERVATG